MTCPDPATVSGLVGTKLTIPTHVTPSGGETTHPSVVFVSEGWNGFRYWMAHTPYPAGNDDDEDPNIVASHDGISWQVPPGLVNPIDDASGQPEFNSDVDLRMGPASTLYLFWRFFDPNDVGAEEKLYYSTTTDGVTWSAKVQFFGSDEVALKLLSPCLLYDEDTGTWSMWGVDAALSLSPHRVVKLTGGGLPTDPWSSPTTVDAVGSMQSGKEPWQLGLIKDGDCYLGLLTDTTLDINGVDGDLLLVTSQDGLTFANSGATVIPRSQPGEHENLYRATLIPETVGQVAGWRVWYSAYLTGPPQVWNVYRTFIASPVEPEPPPVPTPTPVAQAVIRTEVTWYGCDVATGRIIHELPDVTGEIGRLLSAYHSTSLTLPIPIGGHGAIPLPTILQATGGADFLPWRSMLVAVVNDVPAWVGMLLRRRRGTEATLTMACVTPEAYFLHRKVKDHLWVQQDEVSVIAAGLVGDAGPVPGVGQGLPLVVDAPSSGQPRDREYRAVTRQSVYDQLRELTGVIDGPEWTIDVDWADATKQAVVLIWRGRKRIGVASIQPPIFQTAGPPELSSVGSSDATYQLAELGDGDNYANVVTAYSSGEGEDQPTSDPAIDTEVLATGMPIIERDFQPSTSIKSKDLLDGHAAAELARVRRGARLWEITARWDAYPRLGVDWRLGDDVAYDLTGHGHPDGVRGQGRAVGWRLDMQQGVIKPLLLDPTGGT